MSLSSNTSGVVLRVRENWRSALTVALISLPLSIALAIASGAGPIPGIITGVWATVIAALFGSSNYNVVGVAGALTTILFGAALFAGPLILPFLAIASGICILLMYLFKLDRYIRYIPNAVVYGFASGVAILIAANQLYDAFGLSLIKRHGHLIPDLIQFIEMKSQISLTSGALFGVFLIILLAWKKWIRFLPGVIPVAAAGSLIGYLSETGRFFGYSYITLEDKFGDLSITLIQIPLLSDITSFVKDSGNLIWFFQTAFIIAVISVLETLITARIGDKITKTEHSPRKELRGLGLANIASGIMGGLPATGVFIRTGLNIKSGATHKTSQGLAAIFTALLSIIAWPYLQYLPLPVVAAILSMTAIGLIEVEHFVRFWKYEKASLLVGMVVAATTVLDDAGVGVLFGTILALLILIDQLTRGRHEVQFNVNKQRIKLSGKGMLAIPDGVAPDVVVYSIGGFVSYADAVYHRDNIRVLANTPSIETIVIRMRNLHYADLDGIDTLAEGIEDAERMKKKILISSASDYIATLATRDSIFAHLKNDGKFFTSTESALRTLGFDDEHLKRDAPLYVSTRETQTV